MPQSPPPLRGSVSLRLGHGAALTTHCVVIHYRAVTSLPLGGSLTLDLRCEHLIRQTSLRRLRSSATFSKGEGFCNPRFWATDGCAFCDRNDLGSSWAPTPTASLHSSLFSLHFPLLPYRRDRNRHFCFPQHKKAPFFKGAFIVLFLITSW